MDIPCFRTNIYGIIGDIKKERLTVEKEPLPHDMQMALDGEFDSNNEANVAVKR